MRFSKHFQISMIKSFIRIIGCLVGAATKNLSILGGSLVIAEIVGVFEEVYEGK